MGSSGSKASTSCSAPKSSSSSGSFRKARSKGHRSFHSYCLGNTSGSHDSDNEDEIFDHQRFGNDGQTNPAEEDSNQRKILCHGNVQSNKSNEIHCVSSNAGPNEWSQATISNNASQTNRASAFDSSTHSWNPSCRFLSRFSLIPSNISFRLRRTTSLGSSRSCPISSPRHTMLNSEGEVHLHAAAGGSFGNIDGNEQHSHVYPVCLVNSTSSQCFPNSPANLRFNAVTSGLSDYSINDPENSHAQEVVRDRRVDILQNDVNCYSPSVHTETESGDTRHSDRRIGTREPVERNVRFSRTLSVGRLRDRVLRRSSLSDFSFCPPQHERDIRNASQSRRPAQERNTSVLPSDAHAVNSSSTAEFNSGVSSSLFGIQDYEVETSLSREARYQDIMEHRSNFLERRRRIRSQVRALQRLGNRFENLSGHDRSCILSGQHRSGRCTCRLNNREANANDDNSARASISRIVVLAEALFEVLDEIHQQSVVLSSRPSVSSIGSVPAPNEVVESLPIKLYTKLQKHQDEAVQCYICLVEYEDGDSMRVLPCHHEFHRSCVDKWLKEIHRVCPLCRGDICSSGSLPVEN